MDDDHLGPAAEDPVQALLDVTWREAMAGLRSSMEALRRVVPELSSHLPETGSSYVSRALSDATSAYASLHRAGPFVLGSDEYGRYLAAQTARALGA